MGRNNTPTPILDAKGAFLKHPDRKRPDEPKPRRPLGTPPKYLSDNQKQIWKEVARRLPPGVLTCSDRDGFEMMMRLTETMRSGAPMPSSERSTLITLWSRFAMTPADRSKVTVDKPKDSMLDTFLKRRKNAPAPPPDPPVEPPAEEKPLIN